MVNVVIYDILWTKSRRLLGIYAVFYCTICGTLGPLSIVSSVNIYKSTKMKILSIIYIRSFFSGRPSRDCWQHYFLYQENKGNQYNSNKNNYLIRH